MDKLRGGLARKTWLRVYRSRPAARLRLVCFPHAGGAASVYQAWADLLPPAIEVVAVQYPGRQDRYGEPGPGSITALAADIATVLNPGLDRGTAFFGHSMGALVAYETARRLVPRFPTPIRALFASACNSPSDCHPTGLGFGDIEIRRYVEALGGEGATFLADAALFQLAVPVLRTDLRLTEGYRHAAGPPLSCPVIALTGDRDPAVQHEAVRRWRDHTIADGGLVTFAGGHFYHEERLPEVLALIAARLDGCSEGPANRVGGGAAHG